MLILQKEGICISLKQALKSGYTDMLKQLYVFNLFQVGADSMRGLHKRKLELNIEHKKLKIKTAKLKLEKLGHDKKVIQ